MAGVKDLIKKITIPERMLPAKMLKELDASLLQAGVAFSAREWITVWVIVGFLLFAVLLVMKKVIIAIVLFAVCLFMISFYPKNRISKKRADIELKLPDALHQMSVTMRSGMVLEGVIQEISEGDYGSLSEEFARVTVEMKRGRPLKDAFLAFAKRTGSVDIGRAMTLIIEGVDSGGPIADVLEEVSQDMRSIKQIRKERKTATSQQASFVGMAALMAGPFVMGVVAALPAIMVSMADPGQFEDALLEEIGGVITALSYYVFAQAMAGGLMLGVIMYGDMKKGMKYGIIMGSIAYIIFSVVQRIMPGMMKMMG